MHILFIDLSIENLLTFQVCIFLFSIRFFGTPNRPIPMGFTLTCQQIYMVIDVHLNSGL